MKSEQSLSLGMAQLGVEASADAMSRLMAFADELQKWNKVHNLTRVAPGESTISHHLLDSLAVAPFVEGRDIIDVGSGGGFPGMPLAIVMPDRDFTLLDSAGKKTRFLEHVRITLGLQNVRVVQARAESFEGSFDVITCRALASLAEIARMTAHLLAPGGKVLALKGTLQDEAGPVAPLAIERTAPFVVPGIDQPRNLVIMKRTQ